MVIYVVDKEGRADRRECPWLDGTLRGPEAVFALIRYYLSRLGVGQADTLVVIADGARWIWKRVAELVADCGLRAEQVYEVVDFYHVVEHLGIVANAQAAWTEGYRRAWIKTQRQRLLTGVPGPGPRRAHGGVSAQAQPSVATGVPLLSSQPPSLELCQVKGKPLTHWQWGGGECDSAGGQSAPQRGGHVLVRRDRSGDADVTFLL